LTDLIKDDPTGFRLSPRMVAHFLGQWEVYYEGLPTQVGPDESGTAPRASARTMFGAVL
jgi:hypothetical protein